MMLPPSATPCRPLLPLLALACLALLSSGCDPGAAPEEGAPEAARPAVAGEVGEGVGEGATADGERGPVEGPEAAGGGVEHAVPTASGVTRGIDVSHHSGDVDWERVRAAGYGFAYVKATEGVDAADARFAEHWEALRGSGLLRGAYHFYVTEDDPEEQARFFLGALGGDPGDLLPVVDIELLGHGTEPGLPERLHTFLDVVESELGVRPMIYTAPNFWNAHLDASFGDHPLWIAEYGVEEPTLPAGWEAYHLWQWKGDAEVPGVEKGADLSKVAPGEGLGALLVR